MKAEYVAATKTGKNIMELRYYSMRDWIETGLFNVIYVSSENNSRCVYETVE